MKVCMIDDFADQIIEIDTNDLTADGAAVGEGITAPLTMPYQFPDLVEQHHLLEFLKVLLHQLINSTSV